MVLSPKSMLIFLSIYTYICRCCNVHSTLHFIEDQKVPSILNKGQAVHPSSSSTFATSCLVENYFVVAVVVNHKVGILLSQRGEMG